MSVSTIQHNVVDLLKAGYVKQWMNSSLLSDHSTIFNVTSQLNGIDSICTIELTPVSHFKSLLNATPAASRLIIQSIIQRIGIISNFGCTAGLVIWSIGYIVDPTVSHDPCSSVDSSVNDSIAIAPLLMVSKTLHNNLILTWIQAVIAFAKQQESWIGFFFMIVTEDAHA